MGVCIYACMYVYTQYVRRTVSHTHSIDIPCFAICIICRQLLFFVHSFPASIDFTNIKKCTQIGLIWHIFNIIIVAFLKV